MYSFKANGGLNIFTQVSSNIAQKTLIARTRSVPAYVDNISGGPAARSSGGGNAGAFRRRIGPGTLPQRGRPGSPAAAHKHDQPAAWPERYEANIIVTAQPRGIMRPSSESLPARGWRFAVEAPKVVPMLTAVDGIAGGGGAKAF